MSDEGKVQDAKEESTSSGKTSTDSASFAESPNNAHPHRARNITIGVIIAVVIVAVIVFILAFAHPWDSDNAGGTGDADTSGSAMKSSQQVNDADDLSDSGNANTGDGEAGDNSDSASTTKNPTDESDESNDSIDTSDTTAEEEWPGQSLGYVGPNGEGALNPDDYDTNDEYAEALNARGSNVENEVPSVIVEDPNELDSYVEGQLLINFSKACSEYEAHLIVENFGGIWLRDDYAFFNDPFGWVEVIAYFPDCRSYDGLLALADELNALDAVSGAGLNYVMTSEDGFDNEGSYDDLNSSIVTQSVAKQPYLSASRFDKAWSVIKCNFSVTVAVLDRGFDLDHIDLDLNFGKAWDASTESTFETDHADGIGHGTMVSGVLSATADNSNDMDGAAYNAWIIPVRICDDDGHMSFDYINEALRYLAIMPLAPDVINMSFGSYIRNENTKDLIDYLHDQRNVVLVASAGNDQIADNHYPSGYANVISVASVDNFSEHSSFSNYNASVDLCAVGEDIYTTVNEHARDDGLLFADFFKDYDEGSGELKCYSIFGTSFAAPQVSAATALLKAQHSSWSADQVKNRLISTAVDLGDAGRDDLYGYGLLDAAAAVGYTSTGGSGNSGGSSGGGSGWSGGDVFWSAPASAASVDGYLTAYAVRDGSAGPDFLGISNTNFDFKIDDLGSSQYTGYTADMLNGTTFGAGLALWATSVNENPNPYYVNLYYNAIMGTSYSQATTWLSNPETGSWGDSCGFASTKMR